MHDTKQNAWDVLNLCFLTVIKVITALMNETLTNYI